MPRLNKRSRHLQAARRIIQLNREAETVLTPEALDILAQAAEQEYEEYLNEDDGVSTEEEPCSSEDEDLISTGEDLISTGDDLIATEEESSSDSDTTTNTNIETNRPRFKQMRIFGAKSPPKKRKATKQNWAGDGNSGRNLRRKRAKPFNEKKVSIINISAFARAGFSNAIEASNKVKFSGYLPPPRSHLQKSIKWDEVFKAKDLLEEYLAPKTVTQKKRVFKLSEVEIRWIRAMSIYATKLDAIKNNRRDAAREAATLIFNRHFNQRKLHAKHERRQREIQIRFQKLCLEGNLILSNSRSSCSHIIQSLTFKRLLKENMSKLQILYHQNVKEVMENTILNYNGNSVNMKARRVRRWMNLINYSYQQINKKGKYYDNHERDDVKAARRSHLQLKTAIRSMPQIVECHQDETCINLRDGRNFGYVEIDTQHGNKCSEKSKGRSLMISALISEQRGILDMSDEEYRSLDDYDGPQTSTEIFAVGGENYWNAEKQLSQIKKAIQVFERMHEGKIALFVFDHSTCHEAYDSDALVASRILLKDSTYGKAMPCPVGVTKEKWESIPVQHRHWVPRDTTFFCKKTNKIKRQTFRKKNKKIKGKISVLLERGISIVDKNGFLLPDRCKQCALAKDLIDTSSKRSRCCLTRILFLQPDFRKEMPKIFHYILLNGHLATFIPKFHPELNSIELLWAEIKRQLLDVNVHNFDHLKQLIDELWKKLMKKPDLMKKYFGKVYKFCQAYRSGLSGIAAEYVVRKYRGHRRLSKSILTAIESLDVFNEQKVGSIIKNDQKESPDDVREVLSDIISSIETGITTLDDVKKHIGYKPIHDDTPFCDEVEQTSSKYKRKKKEKLIYEGSLIEYEHTEPEYFHKNEEPTFVEDEEEPLIQVDVCPNVQKVLTDVFGHSKFREGQLEAILASIEKKDVFCIMPTAGGKSLIYQLPSILTAGGISLVICPLLSLIFDQVEKLRKANIKAAYLVGSGQSFHETEKVYQDIEQGNIQLLYSTPEKALQDKFIRRLKEISKIHKLKRLIIDEAHVISEWGHDFRPSYNELGRLRDVFPNVPITAVTATATKNTEKDIKSILQMKETTKDIKLSFWRKNLKYEVWQKRDVASAKTKLFQYIKKRKKEVGIIYCLSRKEAISIAEFLQKKFDGTLDVEAYHAGIEEASNKMRIQNNWMIGKTKLIVATTAFSMGIDKPDVRYIIHFSLPRSLAQYYQEAGRGGRDGLPADCIIFFSFRDIHRIRSLIQDKRNKNIRHLENLKDMVSYCLDITTCRHRMTLEHFDEIPSFKNCNEYCDNCAITKNCGIRKWDITKLSNAIIELVGTETTVNKVVKQLKTGPCVSIKAEDISRCIYELIRLGHLKEEVSISQKGYTVVKLLPTSLKLPDEKLLFIKRPGMKPKKEKIKGISRRTRQKRKKKESNSETIKIKTISKEQGLPKLSNSEVLSVSISEDDRKLLPKIFQCSVSSKYSFPANAARAPLSSCFYAGHSSRTLLLHQMGSIFKKISTEPRSIDRVFSYFNSSKETQLRNLHSQQNEMHQKRLRCLLKYSGEDAYLNDSVVNSVLQIIKHDYPKEANKYFFFQSYFQTRLANFGYNGVKSWTKKNTQRLSEFEKVFICVNIKKTHWFLITIDFVKRKVITHETLANSNRKAEMNMVLNYLQSELGQEFNVAKWSTDHDYSLLQDDDCSCGVLMLMRILASYREDDISVLLSKYAKRYRHFILELILNNVGICSTNLD